MPAMNRLLSKIIQKAAVVIVCITIAAVIMGPILIILFTSVKGRGNMVNASVLLPPPLEAWVWDNYMAVLNDKLLPVAFRNSVVLIVVSIAFNILLGSTTAYCLERFRFRFRRVIFSLFYLGMIVPTFILEIARFKLIHSINLYNTLGAPIVIYVASDLMQLYIYRQFISRVPLSLDESALIDGCGYFRIFWNIIFPQLAPATATLTIIKAVNIINDMYIPYLYMPANKLKTLTTFLMNYANALRGSWQKLSAAIVIVMIPTVIVYVFFQRYIFEGISAGAVKE